MAIPYSKEQSTRHASKEVKQKAKPKPIPKKSKKLVDAEKIYNKERKAYLQAYPYCELGCGLGSSCIHHKKGRIGLLLTDPKYFMAVCIDCHKWIHLFPKEARLLGFLY